MQILIIKTGVTETFDLTSIHSEVISLGDVVRTTVLLNAFSNDDVTWVTSPSAQVLLGSIPNVRVSTSLKSLDLRRFDLIINLERDHETLGIIEALGTSKVLGFVNTNGLIADSQTYEFKKWLEQPDIKNLNWSQKLFSLIGLTWNDENYVIPTDILDPSLKDIFDIGLNWQVGVKWPTKKWAQERWEDLDREFSKTHNVSWQQGFDNLVLYMNWINSCKVLVTHDSLGFHIARALNKKVIVLFGPTSSTETPLGAKDIVLSALGVSGFDCLPCYKDHCHNKIHCMDYVSAKQVKTQLRNLLGQMQ